MHIERVQRWVMSSLALTTALIFAGGLALLAGTVDERAGAKPGLLVIAALVGLLAMVGVRALNEARWLTPWLLVGLLPAAGGWYVLYVH